MRPTLSLWLGLAVVVMSAIMMAPSLASVAVTFANSVLLLVMRAVAQRECAEGSGKVVA